MTEFHAFAILEENTPLVPFSYTPRELGPDDVEIKILFCGLCGSDVHMIHNGWKSSMYPLVAGHEIIGTVEVKGENVKGLAIGDRVGVGPQCWSCLECKECSAHDEFMCSTQVVQTYNDFYQDGTVTYGGFAQRIRVHEHFCFSIPASLSSEGAAPLLCAGLTSYTPFRAHNVKPGDKVGVVGIGGLGHLSIQWGRAIGCEVHAISSTPSKEAEALSLGAHHFINVNDNKKLNAFTRRLDFVLVTANKGLNWVAIFSLLKNDATVCLVGAPEEDIQFPPWPLLSGRIKLVGSIVGGTETMKEMLQLAAEKKIEAKVQIFPIEKVNEAIEQYKQGKPRFRFVLKL